MIPYIIDEDGLLDIQIVGKEVVANCSMMLNDECLRKEIILGCNFTGESDWPCQANYIGQNSVRFSLQNRCAGFTDIMLQAPALQTSTKCLNNVEHFHKLHS